MVFYEPDAALAKSAVDVIAREVRDWSESERQQRKLRGYLTKLSQEERDFLLLFAEPKPSDPNTFEHPRLKHKVYASRLARLLDKQTGINCGLTLCRQVILEG